MIYLIGGAPRAGMTILGQQFAAKLRIGWISTDLLQHVLQVKNHDGTQAEWNATAEAILRGSMLPEDLDRSVQE